VNPVNPVKKKYEIPVNSLEEKGFINPAKKTSAFRQRMNLPSPQGD